MDYYYYYYYRYSLFTKTNFFSFLLFQKFPIQWGICAPKQCDEQDLTKLVDKVFACKVTTVYIETFIFSFMLTRTAMIHFLALYDTDRVRTES